MTNSKFTKSETQMLFKVRTRMFNVKENFENMYENDMLCDLCRMSNCTQAHLLQCEVIKSFDPEIEENEIKYKYIFGNDKEMKKVVLVLEKISEIRNLLLEDIN